MQVSPGQIFDGYTFANNTITIALPELLAAQADPVAGNGMEVLRQILEQAYSRVASLAPAARPTKATITKPNPTIATGSAIAPGTMRQAYNTTFDLMPVALEPASEV